VNVVIGSLFAEGTHRRPRLLDLFCGAGGAAMGYHRAGFDVVGVDITPQRHYPFEFHQADAMSYPLDGFDAIHASPPCQRFSAMSSCRPGLADEYPDFVGLTRARLQASGLPWVIENVPGAPLRSPVTLCGFMFGLQLYRHRLFESSFPLAEPRHPEHTIPASKAGHWKPGTIMSVAGHVAPVAEARRAMGIDWMNREEMAEAIPPTYTEHVGAYLLATLMHKAAAA
jgi:DNA (cytosine-5)-methyltransferase 1